jgi:superfamily II DNA or RNA helicase
MGDFFELFGEFLIKKNGGDNRVGIFNYLRTEKNAPGVDGKGVGANGYPATVQFKFRPSNYTITHEKDGIGILTGISWGQYGVRIEDNKNILIITTAAKVSPITLHDVLLDKVRVLDYQILRNMLDNMPEWWMEFYDSVKASRTERENNVEPQTLRPHQEEAAKSTDNASKGKIILPTGTGKTRIEAEIIHRTILEVLKSGQTPLIKVNTSRILLCFQLFEDIYKYLSSHGIHARYMNFNSGNLDDEKFASEMRKMGGIVREVASTTAPDVVNGIYEDCCKSNHPLIIVSTYHSSVRCSESGLVPHLTINDEAHNLVSLEFSEVASLPTLKNIFLTATEDYSSNSNIGMDNVNLFGDYLYKKSPRQMIELGEMVSPKIHITEPKEDEEYDAEELESDHYAILTSTYSALDRHQEILEQTSYDPSQIGGKLLVVCQDQINLEGMAEYFDEYKKKRPDIHLFALSSDFGIYNDGERKKSTYNMDKYRLLESIKKLPSSSKAIIFHVDMIGEGIDVPSITAVMPFRNSNIPKFVQNIGRASRLHPADRERFYKGEITPGDGKYIKPNSWIILPRFLRNTALFFERYRNIVIELRDNYGFNASCDKIIDGGGGLHNPEEVDPVNDPDDNDDDGDSGLDEFQHELESIERELRIEEAEKIAEKEIDKILDNL